MCVNLVVQRKLCQKSRCFPGNFTQLAQILHDHRSWRSRQISTLHVIAHSASVLKWDYHDYPGKNVGGTKQGPNRSQFFKGSQLITSLLIFSVSGVPVSPPSPLVELGRGSNNQNGNLRWFLPWRGGGLEGVSSATYLFWKMIFFKNQLESFPDCENVFCT